jgi:hypothetical protein
VVKLFIVSKTSQKYGQENPKIITVSSKEKNHEGWKRLHKKKV